MTDPPPSQPTPSSDDDPSETPPSEPATLAAHDPRQDRLSRRLKTVPGIFLGALIALPALIVILPLSILFDVVRGKPRCPTGRVTLFGAWYLLWEIFAVTSAGVLFIASGFGALLSTRPFIQAHRWIQVSWANSLLGAMAVLLRMDLQIDNTDAITRGNLLVFSRHASIIDTLLPAHILSTYGKLDLRYVLKQELLWDPALDIVGNRIPNHFVDRSGNDTPAELRAIGALAAGMDDRECFTIFPEGSRFTVAKRERAIERLEATRPDLAERTKNELTHTMPPRTGGPLAILESAPDSDVMFIAHTGLEGLAGVKDLWRSVPFRAPVRVTMWRVPRADVPLDEAGRIRWMFDEWAKVDSWVGANQ